MCLTPGGSNPLFSEVKNIFELKTILTMYQIIILLIVKEYSLIGKIGSFKLQISSSNLDALVITLYLCSLVFL